MRLEVKTISIANNKTGTLKGIQRARITNTGSAAATVAGTSLASGDVWNWECAAGDTLEIPYDTTTVGATLSIQFDSRTGNNTLGGVKL